MHGDGHADGLDVQLFMEAVLVHSTAAGAVCPGDFSNNAVVDMDDVQPFVAVLLGL